MSCNAYQLICTLVLTLTGLHAYGLGARVDISSLRYLKQGSSYTGLGQMTKELRYSNEDNILLAYTINGNQRQLWDDDGLATLFIYHRSITSQTFNKKLTGNSPLPQPITPLLKALEMLKKTYQSIGYADIVSRIESVRKAFSRGRSVSDIRDSGLEALINDLHDNHTYKVETGDDKFLRKKIGELVAVGSPSSLTDSIASRCRDEIGANWSSVFNNFTQPSEYQNDSSMPKRSVQ